MICHCLIKAKHTFYFDDQHKFTLWFVFRVLLLQESKQIMIYLLFIKRLFIGLETIERDVM